jgi:hypothetical protein
MRASEPPFGIDEGRFAAPPPAQPCNPILHFLLAIPCIFLNLRLVNGIFLRFAVFEGLSPPL